MSRPIRRVDTCARAERPGLVGRPGLVLWLCLAGCGAAVHGEPDRTSASQAESEGTSLPAPAASPDATGAGDIVAADSLPLQPAPRAGQDLLGRSILSLLPDTWVSAPPQLGGGPVLLRFWTDTCPYCARPLPAIDALRRELQDTSLTTIAVYHPKPPRAVDGDRVAATAARLGYAGPIAIDPDWASLRRIWLDGPTRRSATSATFLTDAEGRVAWVHPGPELHPSDDAEHDLCDADWADLRTSIERLLAD